MGFRASVGIAALLAIGSSYFVGLWAAWVGIPLLFCAAILHFIDKE